MLTRRLLPLLATLVVLVGSPAAAVLAAAPPVVECPPGQTDCSIHGEDPGDPGGGGSPGGGTGSGDRKCYRGEEEVPCNDPVFGWFNSEDGCYYKLTEPQRPPQDDSGGAWYTPTCLAGVLVPVWLQDAPGGVPPDPETLAREALASITLALPDIQIKPDEGPGLVGLPVWLWVGRSENAWGPISAEADDSGLTVEITAQVTRLTFELGDGKTIECATGGTPYPKGATGPSPDCGHLYQKAGEYTVIATTSWTVTWESSVGGTGTLPEPQIRTDDADLQIDELQVVTE